MRKYLGISKWRRI